MRKIFFVVLILNFIITNAQENHITLLKSSGINFIPADMRDSSNAALHIYNGKTIDIYNNEIALTKSIKADSISIEYQSANIREREVTGAVCTEIIKGEECTDMYRNYISIFDELTRKEKIEAIIRHEENHSGTRSTSPIVVTEPQEGVTFFSHRGYEYNFFAYSYLGERYPKTGIMLDEEERVFRFNALYEFTYDEWGDFKKEYQTLTDKGLLLAKYIDTDKNNSTGSTFHITQTLFDKDEEYEYMRPVYITTNSEDIPTTTVPSPSETPKTSEGESYHKILAISGIEIVKENGDILHSITFDDNYEMIGDLSIISDQILFKSGVDITILKVGEYRYMTFDVVKKEENSTFIYKHFYKIDNITNTIKQVKAPALIKVIPPIPRKDTPFSIEIESNTEGKIVINSAQGIQQQQKNILPGKNTVNVESVEKEGVYIVTKIENGNITESKKFLVK